MVLIPARFTPRAVPHSLRLAAGAAHCLLVTEPLARRFAHDCVGSNNSGGGRRCRPRVFSPGPDLSLRKSLGLTPDDFVIFSPRIFRPLYNIDTIVKAFATVVSTLPKARLLLLKHHASESPQYTREIERLLDELSLRGSTRLLRRSLTQKCPDTSALRTVRSRSQTQMARP